MCVCLFLLVSPKRRTAARFWNATTFEGVRSEWQWLDDLDRVAWPRWQGYDLYAVIWPKTRRMPLVRVDVTDRSAIGGVENEENGAAAVDQWLGTNQGPSSLLSAASVVHCALIGY